jgi:putative Holliday junction resolvase
VVGLDIGTRRIGVALLPSGSLLAVPSEILQRSGDWSKDVVLIVRALEERNAQAVVIGLPLSHGGGQTQQSERILGEAHKLAEIVRIPIYLADERYSTSGVAKLRASLGMSQRQLRGHLDDEAAAVILQSWFDAGGAERSNSLLQLKDGGDCGES